MTTEISETHRIDAATTERSEPNEHWRTAWVLLGGALAALVALNIFTWWVEFGGPVDPEAVVAAEPGLTATAPGMEDMGARPVADGAASIVAAVLEIRPPRIPASRVPRRPPRSRPGARRCPR